MARVPPAPPMAGNLHVDCTLGRADTYLTRRAVGRTRRVWAAQRPPLRVRHHGALPACRWPAKGACELVHPFGILAASGPALCGRRRAADSLLRPCVAPGASAGCSEHARAVRRDCRWVAGIIRSVAWR